MSLLRRSLVAVGCAAVTATGIAVVPASADQTATPTAAIALGDSFISGEGAGRYAPVTDINGVSQDFPGWTADNSNAYFCHRSANASLHTADLSGIDARFMLACSGGQPHDLLNPSINRENGRTVPSQLDQVREVAKTHDIDFVQVGLGSNTSHYTFGDAVSVCANRFVSDAWVGWWEFWVPLFAGGTPDQKPCSRDDLATSDEIRAGQAETTSALRELLRTLDEVDADGEHRVVFQDYTNPLPQDYAGEFHKASGRSDTRDKFRALGRERYAAGCPAHRASLETGHWFSGTLGRVVRSSHSALSAEFPNADLVYLNVQDAFNGLRLCENDNSPTGTLARPLRVKRHADGEFVESFSGYNKNDVKKVGETCIRYFHTCQESWHPNALGHQVLGDCLTAAATATRRMVECDRDPVRGIIRTRSCDTGIDTGRRGDYVPEPPESVWTCGRSRGGDDSRPRSGVPRDGSDVSPRPAPDGDRVTDRPRRGDTDRSTGSRGSRTSTR